MGGQVVGKQRLGVGLLSLIATLREEARLPFGTIQWYLETFHQFKVSLGGLVGVVQAVAKLGQGAVQQVQDRIRASPVVHADETGWREDGHNGYAWTFSTPTERYFVHGRRDKGMVDAALGAEFSGVLVSDFYAAYHHYPGEHQRCWAHLLGDIHDLKQQHPKDKSLWHWAVQVQRVYTKAIRLRRTTVIAPAIGCGREGGSSDPCWRCVPPSAGTRTQRSGCCASGPHCGLSELFVFVSDPRVPSDNPPEADCRTQPAPPGDRAED